MSKMKEYFVFMICFGYVLSSPELLKNADFESSNYNGNWNCNGCRMTQSQDAQHGHSSVEVTHRTHNWAGIQQTMTVQPGSRYVFKGYIKLLNTAPGQQTCQIKLMLQTRDSNGHTHYNVAGEMKYAEQAMGWIEIGFDYSIQPNEHQATLKIQLPDTRVNYLIDNASFRQLDDNSNWKTEANNRIEQLRKANITIRTTNPSGHSTNDVTLKVRIWNATAVTDIHNPDNRVSGGCKMIKRKVAPMGFRTFNNFDYDYFQTSQLTQTKSKFAFGTAVRATAMVDPGSKSYQNFVYENFEWAVLENALKWRLMEWTKGHPNFNKPMDAINALKANGIKVRGHNMFWAVDGHSPKFLDGMSSTELLQAMHSHVNDMIAHTRGKLEHWDVNNEKLHGNYFSRHTGNVNITQDMFNWIHSEEPNVKLFLNDYNVVNTPTQTTAYKHQAKLFHDTGVPIYGVGIQSHFKNSHLDMTALKYRLDTVAEAGLPIWITEFSVSDDNAQNKADALEDAYTLYFSHPAVEGVLMWGFANTHIHSAALATLTNGQIVSPNAAGQRYQDLYKRRWRTNETLNFATQTVRGFKGDYTLTVMRAGQVIQTHNFTLDNSQQINISL